MSQGSLFDSLQESAQKPSCPVTCLGIRCQPWRAKRRLAAPKNLPRSPILNKRVFGLVIDFGTSQSPKSTRPLTTYLCPSPPGHQALRNNFASSLLLRTCLPMTGRRVWMPTLALCARRENSAASRLLGTTSLRFALHGWQRIGSLSRV